jgi:hypothetical protein
MRVALIFVAASLACSDPEPRGAETAAEPGLDPARAVEPRPAPAPEPVPASGIDTDLPAEAPLDEVVRLPAEATPELIAARVDRAIEHIVAALDRTAAPAASCAEVGRSLVEIERALRVLTDNLAALEDKSLSRGLDEKLAGSARRLSESIAAGTQRCMSDPGFLHELRQLGSPRR